jgi:hypothetical protein
MELESPLLVVTDHKGGYLSFFILQTADSCCDVLPRDVMFTGALYRLGNLTIDGGKSETLQIFHAYQAQTKINK